MRKGLTLILDEGELQELYRILLDEDEAAALQFLKQYLHKPLAQALAGG